MSARLAAFLAAVLATFLVQLLRRRRRPAAQFATARRQANWESIEATLADLRRAA